MGKSGRKTQSIITDDMSFCFFCGRMADAEHHLIFGHGRRELCEADGIKIPICTSCHTIGCYRIHDDPIAEKLSKMLGQAIWELDANSTNDEKRVVRSQFVRRYGKSWL